MPVEPHGEAFVQKPVSDRGFDRAIVLENRPALDRWQVFYLVIQSWHSRNMGMRCGVLPLPAHLKTLLHRQWKIPC